MPFQNCAVCGPYLIFKVLFILKKKEFLGDLLSRREHVELYGPLPNHYTYSYTDHFLTFVKRLIFNNNHPIIYVNVTTNS